MSDNLKRQLKNAIKEERNKLETEALNKTEGMIKSLIFSDQPPRESFSAELKRQIDEKRHASIFMKFFQAKVFVPAVSFVLLLSLAIGSYQLGFLNQPISVAKNLFKKEVSQNQIAKIPEQKNDDQKIPKIEGGKKLFSFNLVRPVFAQFNETKENVIASLPGKKIALNELYNLNNFEKTIYPNDQIAMPFSAEQKKSLDENNFFVRNNFIISSQEYGTDDFVDSYNYLDGGNSPAAREPQNSIFITSDYALHLYHLLIDRSFQKIEETKLQPRLKEMTEALFNDSLNNYRAASDPAIKESYKRLAVYYLVPLAVLEAGKNQEVKKLNPDEFETLAQYEEAVAKRNETLSAEKPNILEAFKDLAEDSLKAEDSWIFNTAKAELELINKSEQVAPSPLFTPTRAEFLNDYTQFTPRSHYTKNKILKTYFVSMMWYGRMGFVLKSPEETRDALLITGQINNLKIGNKDLSEQWAEVMALIDFFVGETDDLTAFEYTEVMKKVFGAEATDAQIASDEMMKAFKVEAIKSLNGPKILSEAIVMQSVDEKTKEELLADTMQFRFMGQRFTPDAYVLGKLTQGDEAPDKETGQKLPSTPTALMPISLLAPNNSVIKNYLDAWVLKNAPESDKVITKVYNILVGEFLSLPSEQWNKNIYWSWLNCYRPLLSAYGQGYPFFMKSDNWQKKNLGTVLGSYTELKHDTLLYAKQAYAEMGAGGDDRVQPVVKGYVEPDQIFWSRLLDLAEATKKGLSDRGFLPEYFDGKYDNFIFATKFFKELSEKELKNEKISDDDFERLRTITALELKYIAEALPGEELAIKDRRAGLIADIFTNAKDGEIVYEANAKPNLIYVAVSDVNGTRLTVGAVFDQYEFTAPLTKRLTDEDWQAVVYQGEGAMPERSAWTKEILK